MAQPERRSVRVDNEHMRASYQELHDKLSKGQGTTRSVVRAVAEIDHNYHMVGRAGRFRVEADEPAMRGGTDLAPSPLQYLTLALCF